MLAKQYVDLSPSKLKQVCEQAALRILSADKVDGMHYLAKVK